LPFHNSQARGCGAARGGKLQQRCGRRLTAALTRDSRTLALGGMPPRWLVTEGPQCESAKAERLARKSFIEGPEQAYTTCVRLASFLFCHEREKRMVYSGPVMQRDMHRSLSPVLSLVGHGPSCI
jgi:hypothetical protein